MGRLRKVIGLALVLLASCSNGPADEGRHLGQEPAEAERWAVFRPFLEAYRPAIEHGGGRADDEIWRNAVQTAPAYYAAVSNDIMDVTFGFDFVRGSPLTSEQFDSGEPIAGNLRLIVDVPGATALLDALLEGVREAIEHQDPGVVAGPLRAFFAGPHGQYHPAHTGRCYPHGHPDLLAVDPADCVVEHVEDYVRLLLRAEHFIAPRDPPPAACGCYTREDCGAGGTCHYVPCMPNGKNDGVCTNTAAS